MNKVRASIALNNLKSRFLLPMSLVFCLLFGCSPGVNSEKSGSIEMPLHGKTLKPWIDSVYADISLQKGCDGCESSIDWENLSYIRSCKSEYVLMNYGNDLGVILDSLFHPGMSTEIERQATTKRDFAKMSLVFNTRIRYWTDEGVEIDGWYSDINIYNHEDSLLLSFAEWDGALESQVDFSYSGDTTVVTYYRLWPRVDEYISYVSMAEKQLIRINNLSDSTIREKLFRIVSDSTRMLIYEKTFYK